MSDLTWVTVETGLEPGDLVAPRDLPAKAEGRHRWVAVACYSLSDDQVRDAHAGSVQVNLDHENRLQLSVGCWDCEAPYTTELAARRCPRA